MTTDPICGMTVDEATALSYESEGEMYYFCSEHCRQKFMANAQPEPSNTSESTCCHSDEKQPKESGKYVCPMCEGVESDTPGDCPKCGMALERSRPTAAKDRVIYTCPMHPEIEQDKPGSCPICGMALEAKSLPSGWRKTIPNCGA